MKIIVFRAGKDKKKVNRKTGTGFWRFGFEKFLFFSFICVFLTLVFVQTALMNPSLRTFLMDDNGFEGRPIAMEEYLYDEGEVSLALLSSDINEDLRVLVNGDEVAVFSENTITLSVKDGDVIEVDGSLSADENEIEIVSASGNIRDVELGKKIKVNSAIEEIAKISIE